MLVLIIITIIIIRETMSTRFEYVDIRVLISSKSMDQIKYLIIFIARLIFTFKMTAPQAEG